MSAAPGSPKPRPSFPASLDSTLASHRPSPRGARLWVHTCSLDGPAALHTYRRLGFVAYRHDRFFQAILAAGTAP